MKPFPAGAYCLLATNRPINRAVLGLDYIKGYRLRTGWVDVQPDLKKPNTEFIDSVIAAADEVGQKVGIGVAGGVAIPPLAFSKGVQKFTLLPDDISAENMPPDMALPWDPVFQEFWFRVIDGLGRTYDGNQAISYFVISGFMQLFENRFVRLSEAVDTVNKLAVDAGFEDFAEGYLLSAQTIVTRYVKAFPTTPLILTNASVIPNNKVGDELMDWAKATYPMHFGTMTASLRATIPPHEPNQNPGLTFPKGDQPIFSSYDTARFYMPGTTPDPYPDHAQCVDDLMANAVARDDHWIELYESDAKDPTCADVITARGEELIANANKAQTGPHPHNGGCEN